LAHWLIGSLGATPQISNDHRSLRLLVLGQINGTN
jgi:hypothetical protein